MRPHPALHLACFLALAGCGENAAAPETEVPKWVEISTAGTATCGIDTLQRLFCFEPRLSPTELLEPFPGVRFEKVVRECALSVQDAAYCWGSARTSTKIEGHSFVAVSGSYHAGCGLTDAQTVWCWRTEAESHGQLHPPQQLQTALRFTSISVGTVGAVHACGLTAAGEAYCWYLHAGSSRRGLIGAIPLAGANMQPVRVADDLRFVNISASALHSCALTADGEAWCWGDNSYMMLGVPNDGRADCHTLSDDNRVAWCDTPQRAAVGLELSTIATSGPHTCALDRSGQAYCWGATTRNLFGSDLPAGTPSCRPFLCTHSPVATAQGFRFRSLPSGGFYHLCGFSLDGEVYCWGSVDQNGLPINSTESGTTVPTPLRDPPAPQS